VIDFRGGKAILAAMRDITDRKRMETALAASERLYHELVDGVRDVVFSLSPDGVITMLNPAFERITGLRAEDWIGKPFYELVHPDDRARAIEELEEAREGEPRNTPPIRVRASDGYRLAEISTAPRMEDGRLVGVFGIGRDVSERVSLEQQLRQSQKMEAVGQLAAGIAHDFNNVLSIIMANSDLVATDLPDDLAEGKEEIGEVQKAAQRGKAMVRQLMSISRIGELELRPIELGALAEESVTMLSRILPANVRVAAAVEPGLPYVLADRGSVEQMLLNLVTNAKDAMPDGGQLRIEVARDCEPVPGDVEVAERHPFGRVTLAVTDTGTGMDATTLQRVFEPFFTTKAAGKGTGLGMAMVYGLMKQHGGTVSVASRLGEGTTVRLCFPAARAARVTPVATARPVETVVHRGTETVLVVDDEEALRRTAQRILEKHGYHVLVAEDGEAALQTLREPGHRVDLVFTDLMMPRLGGAALYRQATREFGPVRFLIASGYAASEAPDDEGLPSGLPFVRKPWTLAEVLEGVRSALDAPDAGPQGDAI